MTTLSACPETKPGLGVQQMFSKNGPVIISQREIQTGVASHPTGSCPDSRATENESTPSAP